MPTRIASMKQLKTEAEQGAELFFLLNHGLRSSTSPSASLYPRALRTSDMQNSNAGTE